MDIQGKNKWDFVDVDTAVKVEDTRPSLTYWKDVWRRFKNNKLSIIGLVLMVIIISLCFIGPMFTDISYSDQNLGLSNMPPKLEITDLGDGDYVYVHKEYKLINLSEDGEVLGAATKVKDDMMKRQRVYDVNGKEVVLDYTRASDKSLEDGELKYTLSVDGKEIDANPIKSVRNKTHILGTDTHGRDVMVRVLYGGRISILVGTVAAIMNAIVGVLYGGIAGYVGGKTDNIMMRIVDFVNSIPLILIVILIGVFVNDTGAPTIILTIGLVYWVTMARQVRGQVMSLKQQEFVLAAQALGASSKRIILRHLIPNALGPIVVTMMMSIPSAIFTESFLSFIGLGVSAPQASWGTLANDALGGLRSFPYQLIAPSIAIAITMFALNFIGDGLRDALDPKQR